LFALFDLVDSLIDQLVGYLVSDETARRDGHCYRREKQQCELLEPPLNHIANHNNLTEDCSSAVNREASCCKPTNMVDSVGTFEADDGTTLINITQLVISSCD
jgi:hypothetical protein